MFFNFCILVGAFYGLVGAQCIVPPAEMCLPTANMTELSGCVAMCANEDVCAGKSTRDDKLDCACTQDFLDSYFNCQNDVHRCLDSTILDSTFSQKVDAWHNVCDSRLSKSSITTPAIPTITSTYNFDDCSRLEMGCRSADYETNKCSQAWIPTSSLSYVSCACQSPLYSLYSECQYNGNISCKRTSAYESRILGYSVCSYFWSGSTTLPSIDLTSLIGSTLLGTEGLRTALQTTTPFISNDVLSSFGSLASPSVTQDPRQIPING